MFPDSKHTYNIEKQIKKLKEQEAKAKHFDDYCKLAEDISRGILLSQLSKDIENTNKLREALKAYRDSPDSAAVKKRFLDSCDNCYDEKTINDIDDLFEREWESKTYQKAESLAETFEEYESLAKSIEDNIDDEEWVEKLRKKAEELKIFYCLDIFTRSLIRKQHEIILR